MIRGAQERGIPPARAWSRAELLLAGCLVVLAALAWLLTGGLAMPDMRMGVLTGMSSAGTPEVEPAGFALFLGTWVVMMAAMMLPAIAPFTVGIRRLVRARTGASGSTTWLTIGYLAVWSAVGVLAYFVVLGLDGLAAGGSVNAVRAGAVVLLAAGTYQFSPLKQWCLVRCRSPLALLVKHGTRAARNRRGALAVGIDHGGYCLGCCWALMVVLLAAGVMSLVWMAAIAAVITVEKVAPAGRAISYAIGTALLGFGTALLITPGLLSPM